MTLFDFLLPEPTDDLTEDQLAQIDVWAAEKDDTGNFKRPWARPGHPLQKKAAAIGAEVFEDAAVSQDMSAILGEIERLMTALKSVGVAVQGNGKDHSPEHW